MRMKKLLSLLLAALMVLSLLPMAAFAAEYNNGDEGGVPMTLTVEGTVQYTVNVSASPAQYGTVTGDGKYNEGTSVTVTATPNDGYIFTGWLENGEKVENAGASYTFTASADRNLTAVFEQDAGTSCLLFVGRNGLLDITGVEVGRELEFASGTMITVTAVPKHAGFRFTGWRVANYDPTQPDEIPTRVSAEATYSFNIDRNILLTAGSEVVQYVAIYAGEDTGSVDSLSVSSEYVNESKDGKGYIAYTSEGPDDLKFHFPSADYFPAPEGKVFDCWQLGNDANNKYEAGSVQTVIGSGANPAFADQHIYITAKWKDADTPDVPSCVISVPARIDIPYMQEKTVVNWKLESLNLADHDTLDLTFFAGTFSNSKGQTIAYKVAVDENADVDTRVLYIFNSNSAGARDVTVVDIAKEEWEAAAPGEYTATLRFNVYFR